MADPNCGKCNGSGWRPGTLTEQARRGDTGDVPCDCSNPTAGD